MKGTTTVPETSSGSGRILIKELMARLPPEWPEDLLPAIRAARRDKLVVLDDDPTGTQTVHGLPVRTDWSVESLRAELSADTPAFYVLTNSRGLPLAEAEALNAEIGQNLATAARLEGRGFAVVSRSDSTLRGHFPGEVDALAAALDVRIDACLLIPFFLEGGRYTVDDVHYVAEGEYLTPAGQTEYARDSAFGYRSSNLRAWVAEKTGGRVAADAVSSISIEDIRLGGPEKVFARLVALPAGSVCVVNAASYRDLEVVVKGALAAEARGRCFLYRTAASLVRVRAGLAARPLLTAEELALPARGGGLILVGSHVPRTTRQLERLLAMDGVMGLELSVAALLADPEATVAKVVSWAADALAQGANTVVYTSRRVMGGGDGAQGLRIGREVSEGLVSIVRRLEGRPRYLLAKGGITASDIATRGLMVHRAMVRGQIIHGVPVWQLGQETRYPDLSYVVFPGNVGDDEALAHVVQSLACR